MDTQSMTAVDLDTHKIVSPQEWLEASQALLVQEKALTRQRDAVSRLRRDLPWTRVTQDYLFSSPDGLETLADLFDGRSQLITYHFMYGPGWDEGCTGCSFVSDHIDAANVHLRHHDVTLIAVSRAPSAELQAFKERMGWQFKWVSSHESDFNYDFGASYRRDDLDRGDVLHNFTVQKLSGEEQPGLSVFYKNSDGEIFHTYSSYERGLDMLIGTYHYLDLTPKGRNESGTMGWVRLHDTY